MAIVLAASAIGCEEVVRSGLGIDEPVDTLDSAVDWDGDGYVVPVDCDDADADVHPHQTETCNGIDDDCDGSIDVDAVDGMAGFADLDGDGFGDANVPLVSCAIGPDWSHVAGDCADSDATRFPGAEETCNDVDDDCDLLIDEGVYVNGVRHETIQAAVASAVNDGVVELCGVLQQEGGIAIDRNITVRSTSGDATLTRIDGSVIAGSVFLVDGGDLTLEGVTITGGTGTEAVVNDVLVPFTATAGGAVNALTGQGGTVTVRDCAFEGNTAAAGGAIAARTLTITDSTFVANTADGFFAADPRAGGALWVGPGGLLTVERSVFDGNSAEVGGGLVTYSPTLLLDVEAVGNLAETTGGFGQIHSASLETPFVPNTLEVIAGQFNDNVAQTHAGVFDMVSASGSADASTVFDDNLAQLDGGVLRISSHGESVTWDGGSFTNNDAFGTGGGMRLEPVDSTIVISGARLENNFGQNGGGGIHAVTGDGDFFVRDTVVIGNETYNGHGGGVYVMDNLVGDAFEVGPVGVFERVEIRDNFANDGWGGGLYVRDRAHVSLTECVVADNVADGGGGAISIWEAIVDVAATDFTGNLPNDVVVGALGYDDLAYNAQAVGATFACDATGEGAPFCL